MWLMTLNFPGWQNQHIGKAGLLAFPDLEWDFPQEAWIEECLVSHLPACLPPTPQGCKVQEDRHGKGQVS